jgi:hypothetical protein
MRVPPQYGLVPVRNISPICNDGVIVLPLQIFVVVINSTRQKLVSDQPKPTVATTATTTRDFAAISHLQQLPQHLLQQLPQQPSQ